jgi:hypothetical protein
MRARGRRDILLIVRSTGGMDMYETMEKENLTQPQRHHARIPANRKTLRKPPVTGQGETDQQIAEMERTFTDRWEW